jgi:transposase-like protein
MDGNANDHVTKDEILAKKELANKYNRTFSTPLKQKIVSDFEKNKVTIAEICDLYGVTKTSVYKWIYKYSLSYQSNTKTVVQMESEAQKNKDLYRENSNLLRIIGQKQVELDYLHQLIAQASSALDMDLKKNFASQASNGSKSTPTNTPTP